MTDLFALKYGDSDFRSSLAFADGDDSLLPLSWYFWLLRDRGEVTLIDTGLVSVDLLSRFGVREAVRPDVLVRRLGVEPAEVSSVVLTHLHADHVDGLSLFETTEVIVQKLELEAMTEAMGRDPSAEFAGGYQRRHFRELSERRRRGKLRIVDGDAVVSETLRVELAPYHTRGTQSVIVQVGGETFTLVPDNAYLRANITETRPVGVAVDPAGNRAYLARLAASATTVIPGHDPALGEHFEVLGAGIIRLATSDDREDQ